MIKFILFEKFFSRSHFVTIVQRFNIILEILDFLAISLRVDNIAFDSMHSLIQAL